MIASLIVSNFELFDGKHSHLRGYFSPFCSYFFFLLLHDVKIGKEEVDGRYDNKVRKTWLTIELFYVDGRVIGDYSLFLQELRYVFTEDYERFITNFHSTGNRCYPPDSGL